MTRIIANYVAQRHFDNRETTLEKIWEKPFDATRVVLAMDAPDIRQLRDDDYYSDELGREFFDHGGPFRVEIEEAIEAFFDVESIDDVTQEMVDAKRAEHAEELESSPLFHFDVKFALNVRGRDGQWFRACQSNEIGQVMADALSAALGGDGGDAEALAIGRNLMELRTHADSASIGGWCASAPLRSS